MGKIWGEERGARRGNAPRTQRIKGMAKILSGSKIKQTWREWTLGGIGDVAGFKNTNDMEISKVIAGSKKILRHTN